ncbi:hypothetical protein [Caldanaerobacter subterraneus]|uniref:Uncharacterized protein n=1 Tax=Caldanaerobacter subterraneus subsp. pacificus DSM 12653 TaxID=391606 RepID=A0A0F5PMF1_9THEO|nr:hypothetical protein [Caldanaerobacter subterraneus]KKC29852.1 hypothetical protein CDSM653_01081 [Caldanaerobacter subterraneus subsp. pacificus DSM 12653]
MRPAIKIFYLQNLDTEVDGKMLLNPFKMWYNKINSGKVDRNTQNLLYDRRV